MAAREEGGEMHGPAAGDTSERVHDPKRCRRTLLSGPLCRKVASSAAVGHCSLTTFGSVWMFKELEHPLRRQGPIAAHMGWRPTWGPMEAHLRDQPRWNTVASANETRMPAFSDSNVAFINSVVSWGSWLILAESICTGDYLERSTYRSMLLLKPHLNTGKTLFFCYKVKQKKSVNLLFFKIFLWITISIKSSRWDLFIDMVVNRFIFFFVSLFFFLILITPSCFTFMPKTSQKINKWINKTPLVKFTKNQQNSDSQLSK